MSVSDGADLEELINLLNAVTNGTIGALGTGLGAGSLNAGVGVAGATVNTLNKIMRSEQSQGNINVQVNMTNIDVSGGPQKISVTSYLTGWTVTTDTDAADEKANVSHQSKLLAGMGNVVETKNEGRSSQIQIDQSNSVATTNVNAPQAVGICHLNWNLSTDGAITHDTVSIIQIDTITVVCKYEP